MYASDQIGAAVSDPDRWQRLQEIFHEAISLETQQRERLLSEACGGDDGLRTQVDRLLAAHERPDGVIEEWLSRADDLVDEEDAPSAGQLFGPYRVVREIGRGGMGSVYLGERADGAFQQQVAIKVIKRGMDTAQVLARFRAERQILASLDHPNIARLLDGGTSDTGHPYFVMEYIDGEPIDVYADAHALTIPQRLALFLQVAGAVTFAHQQLIVHRDIKPLNILTTSEGVPKLLDFGIAKVLHPEAEEATSTATGWRLLTPDYASPEQVAGRHASTASDVYSLGVVLYELLTGVSPYRLKDRTPQDVAHAVSTTEPLRPSAAVTGAGPTAPRRAGLLADRAAATGSGSTERLRRRLRGDLDTIVLTALRKEPQRRYQSVEQFAGDVRRYLDGLPVRARRDTVGYRVGQVRGAEPDPGCGRSAARLRAGGWHRRHRLAGARGPRRTGPSRAPIQRRAASWPMPCCSTITTPSRTFAAPRRSASGWCVTRSDTWTAWHASRPTILRSSVSWPPRTAASGTCRAEIPKGLGDTKGAVESYAKALGMLETLVRADRNDLRTRRDLADVALELGNMVWGRGDLAAGLAHARRARTILEDLVASSPQDVDQRLLLHEALDILGQMSLEGGEVRQALEFYRADLQQLDQIPERERQRPDLRRAISITYGHLADAQIDAGDVAGALENHRRSLAIRQELAAEFPDNADYEYLVQSARYYLATVLGRMGRWAEALELFQRNLAESPKSGFNQYRAGQALMHLGRPAHALPHFRRALQFHQEEYRADPDSLFNRLALAMDQSGICSALAQDGPPGRRGGVPRHGGIRAGHPGGADPCLRKISHGWHLVRIGRSP